MKKIFLALITGVIVFNLAACVSGGDKTSQPAASNKIAVKEIVFQSWITPNLTAEFYDGVIKKFEDANPDIKVKRIQPPANESTPDNYLKTLLAAGDFPDVVQNATTKLFVDANALMEIPVDDDIKKINNYTTEMVNGKLYNISAIRQPTSLVFYNKKMFADAGITTLPKTWAEFEAVCAKLKAKGFTPILASGDWVAGNDLSVFVSPTIYKDNPIWYTDRYAGKVKFTDPNWVEAVTFYSDLVNKGYFNKGVLSIDYATVEQEFLKGNGAMYPMGSWFSAAEVKAKKDFEVGVFPQPTKDGTKFLVGGENTGGFSVAKNSKQSEAALKFAKFMIFNPEAGKGLLQADAAFSNLKDPIVWVMSPLQKEIWDTLKDAPPMTGHYNNKVGSVPVSGIQDQYNKVGQDIFFGNADVKKELQTMDDYWNKNNK